MPYIVPDKVVEPLYVIVPVSNPWRWKSRWKHTERAIKHFMDSGAVVVLVEVAFNRRTLAFENSGLDGLPANCGVLGNDHRFRHRYIGLRSKSELWLKENQINLAVERLPYDWMQVAWLDSDVVFMRPNWVGECIHKLQHYAFLQMFSQARDLAPDYEMMPNDYPHADGIGFVTHFQNSRHVLQTQVSGTLTQVVDGQSTALQLNLATDPPPVYYGGLPRVWPGLAWACTREAWDAVGGLMDFAVWGGGDWHMAHALIQKREGLMHTRLHQSYQNQVMQWYERSGKYIRQNVGVMSGVIFHNWHGRKTERGYAIKHRILADIGFDPTRHLKRDYQGLWQLHDDGSDSFVLLRDTMRQIAKERDEDSADTRLDLWKQEQGH